MSQNQLTDQVEPVARYLATEDKRRADEKRGYSEIDDFADAIGWMQYTDDAFRLLSDGAKMIGGKLVI